MRAILSVWDKTGVVDFAQKLRSLGFELFSTGGTHLALHSAGIPVGKVEDMTGSPEILGGRVKTLHPKVHGGILALRDSPAQMRQLREHGIEPIDLVCVNLYPFQDTVARPGTELEEALENIDIGGPTMIRAAAKNYPHVLVVVDPADYDMVVDGLRHRSMDAVARRRLAQKAFQHVAAYDTLVAQYLRNESEGFPEVLTVAMQQRFKLRYGENPHQAAAFYVEERAGLTRPQGIGGSEQLWGKELSFNNILDADAAWNAASDFGEQTIAIIKHTNPCGLASHPSLVEAYRRALEGDPVSAYGGIVASNRAIDLETAGEIAKTFYEIVIAPGFAPEALQRLQKKRDLRILQVSPEDTKEYARSWDFRRVRGGFLVQDRDTLPESNLPLRTVTETAPTEEEVRDLLFAYRAVKHVKSNAIVLAKDQALLGMGAGQPNRVTSVRLAIERAGEQVRGSVLASDAFFPFADSIELAGAAGVRAVIQPGGSIRDEEVIAACNRYGIAMVLTGERHFRH